MSEKSYLLRLCDQELQIALQSSGAVLIEVITGGQYAYRRNDGVLVVPIGCLKN